MEFASSGDNQGPEESLILPEINAFARRCAELFLHHTRASERQKHYLQDELGRFKIWAGNLGVFADGRSSADYRLRYEPDIKDVIIKLLKRLEGHLKALPITEEPFPAQERQQEEDSDSIYSSDSSLGISGDESSQEEHQEPIGDRAPEDPVLKKINDTITHLYRITAIIKKPHSSKEEGRVRAWIARQGPEMDEQLQDLESYVKWSIGRTLPRVKRFPILAARLVQSVLLRRKKFLYRASHRMKLQRGVENAFYPPEPTPALNQIIEVPASQSQNAGQAQLSMSKGKSKAVTFVDTVASSVNRKGLSSYAKSTVLSAISPSVRGGLDQMDVPPPPKPETGSLESICPYCSLPLSKELIGKGSTLRWKHHVLLDLEPYICLFEDCDIPGATFKTKEEWIDHMARQHTKIWSCHAKGHEDHLFRSSDMLVSHLQEAHSDKVPSGHIPFMVEKCAMPAPDVFVALAADAGNQQSKTLLACSFCEEEETHVEVARDDAVASFPRESYKLIRDHICSHLETLALLSLPEREDVENSASNARLLSSRSARRMDEDTDFEDLPSPVFDGSDPAPFLEGDNILNAEEYWESVSGGSLEYLRSQVSPEDDDTLRRFREVAKAKYRLPGYTGSPETLELARSWIKKCNCVDPHTVPAYPKRLIDLQSLKEGGNYVKLILRDEIRNDGRADQYVTLTHSWDDVGLMLNGATNEVLKNGINVDRLPLLFRQAIAFACTLEYVRYFWVDSLCIYQDSYEDSMSDLQELCDVWNNSYLNITAASAQTCRDSLYVQRNPTSISAKPMWPIMVYNTWVNRRVWALQEELMNRRKLYFCHDQIAWECFEGQKVEGHPENYASYDGPGPIWFPSIKKYRKKLASPIHEEYDWAATYECWACIVEDFTKLSLQNDQDKLPALSSMARRFHLLTKSDYIAGMWLRNLESQLLWHVRKLWDGDGQVWLSQGGQRPQAYRAPSFSWAAVDAGNGVVYCGLRGYKDISIRVTKFHSTDKDAFGLLTHGGLFLTGKFPLKRLQVRKNAAVGRPYNHDYVGVHWRNPEERIGNPMLDSTESDADMLGPDGGLYYFAATPATKTGGEVCYTCLLLQEDKALQKAFKRVGLIEIIGENGRDYVREVAGDEKSMPCARWDPNEGEFGKHTILIT